MNQEKTSFRTTLSIPEALRAQIEEYAKFHELGFLESARRGLSEYFASIPDPRSNADGALASAFEIVKEVKSFSLKNPYLDVVASWRLRRTGRQVRLLSQGQVDLEAHPADIYLLLILTELQAEFGEKDEFLVVTSASFWHSTSLSESFLAASKTYLSAHLRALAKGMRLCRVIVLTDEEMTSKESFIEQHLSFSEKCEKEFPGQTRLRFLPCESAQAAASVGHFACIRRRDVPPSAVPGPEPDTGCLLVNPIFDRGGAITSLQFIFSNGPTHDDRDTKVPVFLDRLLHADARSQPLSALRQI